ncbi:hypothetical protein AVEN_138984-1 [Araneus ventricosus]|uniref:Uncharacterized protein n=1 Tax=Araneus ventricosus TaxID=182803 RepID=A0A4Y2T0P5_ARAVE|nr:hypothetical protein AVEN_138984-1 [Araneus ventricosus]
MLAIPPVGTTTTWMGSCRIIKRVLNVSAVREGPFFSDSRFLLREGRGGDGYWDSGFSPRAIASAVIQFYPGKMVRLLGVDARNPYSHSCFSFPGGHQITLKPLGLVDPPGFRNGMDACQKNTHVEKEFL